MLLPVHIRGKTAVYSEKIFVVCCNSDYRIAFSFDSEWDTFTEKTAVFQYRRNGTVVTEQVPFSGCICPMPVITDTDEVLVGVYAGSIQTAAPARIPCCRSVTDCPSRETPPVPDPFNRIMELLAEYTKPVPAITVHLLRDSDNFGLRDCNGFALKEGG